MSDQYLNQHPIRVNGLELGASEDGKGILLVVETPGGKTRFVMPSAAINNFIDQLIEISVDPRVAAHTQKPSSPMAGQMRPERALAPAAAGIFYTPLTASAGIAVELPSGLRLAFEFQADEATRLSQHLASAAESARQSESGSTH